MGGASSPEAGRLMDEGPGASGCSGKSRWVQAKWVSRHRGLGWGLICDTAPL